MKIIEVDEELYQYIASKTQSIGESASDILRRLLDLDPLSNTQTNLETSENVPLETPQNSQPPLELSVANKGESQTVKLAEEEKENLRPTVKKQSEQAIQQVVSKVRALLQSEEFVQENKAVVRFLAILKVLYRTHPESFAQATESLQGRTRVYFARDEATLLAAGNHTKPKQIPDTPYWVITNTNSGRKMLMLEGAMQSMQLPEDLIEEVRSFFVAN
ncbi:negative regulator of replication initiation SeqA [Volucribacter psittacicida]|uniref:Negative modulator of initiation of replication n=1 Tax=Volucribacter psittacicida TaxID=203482 RepID=A0A4R1FPL9_9PAST|nr:replication initiation negative regulator SeqA [Volucribacter psittacicida]TCJ96090.1 negative regulator of replication initiation SeqA [Volucribacter psittacicida]